MGKKELMTKLNHQQDDGRYHNTWLLLRKYRDVLWAIELSVSQARMSFRRETGKSIDDYLESIYEAGIDLNETKLRDRANNIQRSVDMVRLVDGAVDIMRQKHKRGEEYYWILYYTFLSPQEHDRDEILELLDAHVKFISVRTYYRKRGEAINILGNLLWGYTDRQTLDLLQSFLK